MVDPRLEAHDSNQLELKLAYVLEPGERKQRYLVESFMFVPRTLGVSAASYDAQRFFEDTSSFVRLKTPDVALEALGQVGRAEQWFDPVRAALDTLLAGGHEDTDPLVRHIKLLGAIYRVSLRDEGKHLLETFDAVADDPDREPGAREAALSQELSTFVSDLERALARLARVGSRCSRAMVPQVVRDTWAAVDEYVSIYAEEICTHLVAASDDLMAANEAKASPLAAVREKLADAAIAAYHHRRSHGYESYAIPGESNEELPHRRRILKRIISSALFLDTTQSDAGWRRDVVAGVAAAAAMLFAVLVALWAQIEWGVLSSTFVVIAVLSYILKDRIKEWVRRYLGRRLARWMPDRVVHVRDMDTERVLGWMHESVSVLDPDRVDKEITAMRLSQHSSAVAAHGRPEVVLRYVKQVQLQSKPLQSTLVGCTGLNDVIRFNFAHLRGRMDAPLETYQIVHPIERRLVSVPCHRIYHVNLLVRFTVGNGDTRHSTVEHVRILVDQRGIHRVDAVEGGEPVRNASSVTASVTAAPARLLEAAEAK